MKPTHIALAIGALALCGAGAYAATRGRADDPEPEETYISTPHEDFSVMTQIIANPDANVQAFLNTIAQAEGTAHAADPYRVCYAYKHTIADFSDHPAVTGEWKGEPLSAKMCLAAGHAPGCVSSAAGKYQIIKPTWLGLKAALGLPDFSPASQDAAAIELLRRRGALAKIQAGDIEGACAAARKEWASFPAAGYSQGERTVAWMVDRFTQAGGTLA
jgi:lysozyme